MTTGVEFSQICQAQLELLSQALGASLSAVYLVDPQAQDSATMLVPIALYPVTAQSTLAPVRDSAVSVPAPKLALPIEQFMRSSEMGELSYQRWIPLRQGDQVLGLLVTRRDDRDWTEPEALQLEQIADTLALGRSLDQQNQLLQQQLQHRDYWQLQEQDRLEVLLHQIKNPLTALRTFAKLLLRRMQPEERNRQLAASLLRESDRLADLLNLLNSPSQSAPTAALPSANPLLLNSASPQIPTEVDDYLPLLIERTVAIAQEKGLAFEVQDWRPLPPVLAPASTLQEILGNLLENACKYTPVPGCIGLSWVALDAAAIAFCVWDDGPQIPAEDLPHLFERNFRGVQGKGEIPGSGLGLAIARDLSQSVGGDLRCYSPAAAYQPDLPKTGVAFVFTVPVWTNPARS
ncbi:GAF domain-containing sensor histidine kinase [Synechococcus elongatus]|uniref:GAF domain-containing sensor histidine kinase n=1 Tax=Synechococcus elongatus TaxID=32046 RepID=UPI000F7E4605|nr:GAF domain-containing sensor histidine kinase [Synechococcus elongatus]